MTAPTNARHFIVRHEVNAPLARVWNTFAKHPEDLFKALSPPFPAAKLKTFGGTTVGAKVELDLQFGLWTSHWQSIVTEQVVGPEACWFVDEGTILPLGMTYFRHKHHLIASSPTTTTICEDITLAGGNWLITMVNYLGFLGQMQMRGSVYKGYWG